MEKPYGKVERAERNLGFIVGKYFQNFLRSMQDYWNKQTKEQANKNKRNSSNEEKQIQNLVTAFLIKPAHWTGIQL